MKEHKSLSDFQKFKLKVKDGIKSENLNTEYRSIIDLIKLNLGSLEDIRKNLALSRRQICKLLLVDPSAWTRWTKPNQDAPPHIYQALNWYSQLVERSPDIHAPLHLESKFDLLRKDADLKMSKMQLQIQAMQTAKTVAADPYFKFSDLLSENFKNLSDRLVEVYSKSDVQELLNKIESLEAQITKRAKRKTKKVKPKKTKKTKPKKKAKKPIKKKPAKRKKRR
jgi:hypothetical protein